MKQQKEKPRPTKAVIYARVSSEQQTKKGDGLKSQIATSRLYAERMGYDVVATFEDVVTGRVSDRDGMNAMLDYLQKHKAEGRICIIDDVSRMARNRVAHYKLRDKIIARGGFLESPTLRFGETPEAELQEELQVAFAGHHSKVNARQARERMKGRVLNGYWPFYVGRGYRHQLVKGQGKVLVRDEPAASLIQEALEGYASGRFQTQSEVTRFMNAHPSSRVVYPVGVTNQMVKLLLTRSLYAGYVEAPLWDIPLRKGNHEGLISFETYQRIQDRLNGKAKAPARADINAEFPLRGCVGCAECGKALTSCFSTGKMKKKYAYYHCFNRDCARYGKSMSRDTLEGQFTELLQTIPLPVSRTQMLAAILKKGWELKNAQAASIAKECRREAAKLEQKIGTLLERIVQLSSDAVIATYEKHIDKMTRQKLLLHEKAENCATPPKSFGDLFELAIRFLASPYEFWRKGDLVMRKVVMRLTFAEMPLYDAITGFRTPVAALPFAMLSGSAETGISNGGKGGIRTHGTLAGTPVFKTGALNHSATFPSRPHEGRRCGLQERWQFADCNPVGSSASNQWFTTAAAGSFPNRSNSVRVIRGGERRRVGW